MTNTPERCEAKVEAARSDDHGNVMHTDAGETFTEPLQCVLAAGHSGEHRATDPDGESYTWSD